MGSSHERLSDEQIVKAKANLRAAFLFAELDEAGLPMCPIHKRVHANALVLKRDSWFCYSAREGGNAVTILTKHAAKPKPFPIAVKMLLGEKLPDGSIAEVPDRPLNLDLKGSGSESKTSTVDSEVYQALLTYSLKEGGFEAAAAHYGRWAISSDAVRKARIVMLTAPAKVQRLMLRDFGRERLLKAGLITESMTGRVNWMVNRQYPVIEPHISPDGKIVGLQFRASEEQEKKIAAHKKYSADVEAGKASEDDKVKFVPKFLSLAGVSPEKSLVGGGLDVAAGLPAGSKVLLVEGIKDMMAAWTMGHNAVALPGVSAKLSPALLQTIRPLHKIIALDGDDAGQEAVKTVGHLLQEDGQTNVSRMVLPEGQDVTDVLMSRQNR